MENDEKGLLVKSQVEGLPDWSTNILPKGKVRDAAEWLIKNGYGNEKDVKSAFYDRQKAVDISIQRAVTAKQVRYENDLTILGLFVKYDLNHVIEDLRADGFGKKNDVESLQKENFEKFQKGFGANYWRIPKEMQECKQWVCFKLDNVDGKLTKRLLNPYTGKWASLSVPRDWSDYKTAYRQAGNYGHEGIAFVLTNVPGVNIRNDIFCIDLDHALTYNQEGDNFKLTPEAEKIIEKFKGTYIEQSASGTGVHIFGIGNIPNNVNRGGIELYDSKKIISMTGSELHSDGKVICKLEKGHPLLNCKEQLNELFNSVVPKMPEQVKNPSVIYSKPSFTKTYSDSELKTKIENSKQGPKFNKLMSGNFSGYTPNKEGTGSNEADMALCNILAFWTSDPSQIDRIFKESGLYSGGKNASENKWDKHRSGGSYGEQTIRKALSYVTSRHDPYYNTGVKKNELTIKPQALKPTNSKALQLQIGK